MPETREARPLTCPKCGTRAAVAERVVGTVDWGLAIVADDGVVHPAEPQEPPAVMADNSTTLGAWAFCDDQNCGHQWKLRRRFDSRSIREPLATETVPSPNPTTWIHFILACAVPDPEMPDGICGEFIESEPCPRHGTEAPDA